MNIRWLLVGSLLGLAGCVTLDANTAASKPTAKLCEVALTGTDGWNAYDDAGRLAAEQEAARRGSNCQEYAAGIYARRQAIGNALGTAAQISQQSGWQAPPTPPPGQVRSTSCMPLANGMQSCTTRYTDGTSSSMTCHTLSNGQTHCQ